MEFIKTLRDILISIWKTIKRVVRWIIDKVYSFTTRITNFFTNLYSNNPYLKKPNIKAIGIKVGEIINDPTKHNVIDIGLESINSTDAILTTTFNTDTNEIDLNNAQIVEFETLDNATKESFGDKPLIILK